MKTIEDTAKERQLGWLGHLFRMDEKNVTRKVFEAFCPKEGRRTEDPGKLGYRSDGERWIKIREQGEDYYYYFPWR